MEAAPLDPRRALEREETAAAAQRLRTALALGIPIWLTFGITDWLFVTYIYPGRLSVYWGLRAAGAVLFALVYLRLCVGPPPGRRTLRALDVAAYTVAAAIVSVFCLEGGGLASHSAAGIPLVLVCHALTMADRWKRNIVPFGLPALAHPATIGIGALLSPETAAQIRDPRALATFAFHECVIACTYLFLVVGGHLLWAARREATELRGVGRYEPKRRIGRGAMGEVWRAYDRTLKRDVALKIVRSAAVEDPTTRARFVREVRAMSELTHPNTVRIFDHGVTEDGDVFYAMELLEGLDLGTLVARTGPLPPWRAIRIGRQAARALAEAHARGIVHRDVKPANLFLTTPGGEIDFVKVLDFGVAKITRGEGAGTLTEDGYTVGTPAYIAPEVVAGGEADACSDIYALGAVLYFLLAGRQPFEAPDAMAVLMAHLEQEPLPPSAKRGEPLPRDLEALVIRCLAKRPQERFASAQEVVVALSLCADAARAESVEAVRAARP